MLFCNKRRSQKNHGNRALRVESLEHRQLLAGGAVEILPPLLLPAPIVQVTNVKVPILDILPGGQDKILAEVQVKVIGRAYARFDEAIMVSAFGGGSLARNTQGLELRADLNGRLSDGCEAVVAYARADWETDTAYFKLTKPVWVMPTRALRLQVVADFGSYLEGETIGVDATAWFGFRDLRNNQVPDGNVRYRGVDPVLHNLEDSFIGFSQEVMLPAGSILPGQKNVPLIKFSGWTNKAIPGTINLSVDKNLAYNYRLLADYNWDGLTDEVLTGTVVESGGVATVQFTFGPGAKNGGSYKMVGDVFEVFTGPLPGEVYSMQAAFTSEITGTDAETGLPLKGFVLNGVGEGQIQLYDQVATRYTLVMHNELTVKELQREAFVLANPGDKIVLDAFTMLARNDLLLTSLVVGINIGETQSCDSYSLWTDSNEDGEVDLMVGNGEAVDSTTVVFDRLGEAVGGLLLPAGSNIRFEVRAVVKDPLCGYGVRAQLTEYLGLKRPDNTNVARDRIFAEFAWQTFYSFYDGRG